MRAESVSTISGLQERILHDGEALDRFVYGVSCRATEMFEDPIFFLELRNTVMPMLRTFPMVRVWVSGCGRGEDVYSLAILFREAGMSKRYRIYATDVSTTALVAAKEGHLRDTFEGVARRYLESGGVFNFSDYVSPNGTSPSLEASLRENIVFSTHNLVSDGSFNEFHLIVCRGVVAQFNKTLAYRAHQVLFESMTRGGYLALGLNESVRFSPHQRCFERVSEAEQLYRRIR
jgi:chemotaxis protein methyltransferase CheR